MTMTKEEFKENVDDLFKEYKKLESGRDDDVFPVSFRIKENYKIVIIKKNFGLIFHSFTLMYISPYYNDFEKYLDELIIFKELILPKYL